MKSCRMRSPESEDDVKQAIIEVMNRAEQSRLNLWREEFYSQSSGKRDIPSVETRNPTVLYSSATLKKFHRILQFFWAMRKAV